MHLPLAAVTTVLAAVDHLPELAVDLRVAAARPREVEAVARVVAGAVSAGASAAELAQPDASTRLT